MRRCPSDREAEVFLMALGELRPTRLPLAVLHWMTCSACRQSVGKMRHVSKRLGRAATPAKLFLVRFGTAMVAMATVSGLYVLGREAVGAAVAAMDRPKMQNASYELTEPKPGLPKRTD